MPVRANDVPPIRRPTTAIKNAVNNLHTAAHAMAQQAGRGASEPPPSGGSAGGKPGDDVIDAEFEVKK